MRILMVSKACLVGAYQTKLEAIASFENLELTVIVPPVWNDPAGDVPLERSHTKGYQLLVDPINFNGQFHLHYYPRLKERLRTIKPDILHMDEEPYNLATWLAIRQARSFKVKSLFFSWQNIYREYPFPFRQMEKFVLENVDYAIMGNRASVEIWQRKGYRGPHEVIPQFGVDTQTFKPPQQRDEGRGFVVGFAGRRLVPEKGVDLLLQAIARLPGMWQLLVAGEGPQKQELQKIAQQLGIIDRVHFVGGIPSNQVPAYMGQLDVLVQPSRTIPAWKEQFGRVLVEAMACEIPVVGSNSGEIPNVIGDAGFIFPEDDVDALFNILSQLQRDPSLRQEMGRLGRKRVQDHFTQDKVAAATIAVYSKMLTE